jgi:hypothetical protein
MTTPEPPLPNLLGFIADENKGIPSLAARDRAEIDPGLRRLPTGRGD